MVGGVAILRVYNRVLMLAFPLVMFCLGLSPYSAHVLSSIYVLIFFHDLYLLISFAVHMREVSCVGYTPRAWDLRCISKRNDLMI